MDNTYFEDNENFERLMFLSRQGNEQEIENFINRHYKDSSLMLLRIMFSIPFVFYAEERIEAIELLSRSDIFGDIMLVADRYDLANEIKQLIVKCSKPGNSDNSQQGQVANKVLQIIEQEYADDRLSLFHTAKRLNISHGHLSSMIKKQLGRNFKELLTERRMKKARDLVSNTDLKVFEIAKKCGFSDQYYFSFSFKKYFGVSPQKLRENLRKKPV